MTFCYILNCYLFATNLVWQCRFINWSVLWNGCFAVFSVTVKVRNCVNFCPDNISDQINLIWWCTIMSQSIVRKYSYAIFKVKATIIFNISSEILKLLQPKLVWWYIITRQLGKTLWKGFLAFTHGMRPDVAWVTMDQNVAILGHPDKSDISSRGQYWFQWRKCEQNITFVMNTLVY